MDMIELDGAQGEGGGQILRTALSLAMGTGRAFRLRRIRAGRAKPGLMRQHLTCVQAARRVCGAHVEGDEIGSTQLTFTPGEVHGGVFSFAIGTAGSTMLVLQTVLPALLLAPESTRLSLEGGTHAMAAPSTDFIAHAFLPVLRAMGARVELRELRPGFFPVGGGRVEVTVEPARLQPIALLERGESLGIDAEVLLHGLPDHIAERELAVARERFDLRPFHVCRRDAGRALGAGNALMLRARFEHVTEIVTGLGQAGVSAELVAGAACDELAAYLHHGAPVGEHLADQLLLPMWLAGGGSFVTGRPSSHLQTNADVLMQFGAARVVIAPDEGDPQRRFRVTVSETRRAERAA